MKILVVSYLPGKDKSRTKRLLDTFFDTIKYKKKDKNKLEILDLVKDTPDLVNPDNLQAYKQRNYMGKEISKELKESIAKFDRMTAQFKSADIVVMAFPMYNFSMPAAVKAYFDSILLKGETFDTTEKGFVGLMQDKRALVLMSSGGKYPEGSKYDHAMPLVKIMFAFMGFEDIKIISAQGLDIKKADVGKIVAEAQKEIKKVVNQWGLSL